MRWRRGPDPLRCCRPCGRGGLAASCRRRRCQAAKLKAVKLLSVKLRMLVKLPMPVKLRSSAMNVMHFCSSSRSERAKSGSA